MRRAASNYRDGEAIGFDAVSKYVTHDLAYIVEVERLKSKVGGREDISPVNLRVTSIFRREDVAAPFLNRTRIVARHRIVRVGRGSPGCPRGRSSCLPPIRFLREHARADRRGPGAVRGECVGAHAGLLPTITPLKLSAHRESSSETPPRGEPTGGSSKRSARRSWGWFRASQEPPRTTTWHGSWLCSTV